MTVDLGFAILVNSGNSERLYFCSSSCAQRFLADHPDAALALVVASSSREEIREAT